MKKRNYFAEHFLKHNPYLTVAETRFAEEAWNLALDLAIVKVRTTKAGIIPCIRSLKNKQLN